MRKLMNKKQKEFLGKYLKKPSSLKINKKWFKNAQTINKSVKEMEETHKHIDKMRGKGVNPAYELIEEKKLRERVTNILDESKNTESARGLSAKKRLKEHQKYLDKKILFLEKEVEINKIQNEMIKLDEKEKNYPKSLKKRDRKAWKEIDKIEKELKEERITIRKRRFKPGVTILEK